ncbi:MAG: glycosyltransferase [Bacteroidetes bacterium]|nr:glycosyltransferase [Bacteroidota bacterium]
MADHPHILLFDLYSGGHHRMYLELLSRYWIERGLSGKLELVVTTDFCRRHVEFCDWIEKMTVSGLALTSVSPAEAPKEGTLSLNGVLKNDRIHGDVLGRRIRATSPDHVLLMYFDHCQFSLARRKIMGVACSGVYFRPSFHYRGEFLMTKLRKRILLSLALNNPSFRHLFCLDPYAVPVINASRPDGPALWLPDGFSESAPTRDGQATRRLLGVKNGRSVVLFFGVVSARKGIHEAIEALRALPGHRQKKTTLLVAGKPPQTEYEDVRVALERLERGTSVQVINLDRFIDEDEIGDYFEAADLALVTYRRHIGSSNVLIRAAAARIPVVGSDYGLVGKQIREHSLGTPVDTTDSVQLAGAIEIALRDDAKTLFDPESAARFARDNSADRFAETIFSRILPSRSRHDVSNP